MRKPNLIDKLNADLAPAPRRALRTLTALAEDRRLPLYLVGGPVRDLLLNAPALDLDFSLEGAAPALAREAAADLGARCVVHPAFLTASLKGPGFALDLATARSETYERPGALPRVQPATIRQDMLRRDFTINALALPLTGPDRGQLFDPASGRADLKARLIRVLHEGSFRDDATRVLRAARYEARFHFQIEERTLAWLTRDAHYLDTISGARLRQELSRILHEPEPERALLRLAALGALAALHPALRFDQAQAAAMARLRERSPEAAGGTATWALLAWRLSDSEAAALAARLALTRPQAEAVGAVPHLRRLEDALAAPSLRPSRAAALLSPYPAPALWALAAAAESNVAAQRCRAYLRRWRYVKPILDGHAFLALGVPPGPKVGHVLRRLKAAKLDGEVRSRADEERLVRTLLGDPARA